MILYLCVIFLIHLALLFIELLMYQCFILILFIHCTVCHQKQTKLQKEITLNSSCSDFKKQVTELRFILKRVCYQTYLSEINRQIRKKNDHLLDFLRNDCKVFLDDPQSFTANLFCQHMNKELLKQQQANAELRMTLIKLRKMNSC